MTTTTQHEAVKIEETKEEREEKEKQTHAEKVRARAIAAEEKLKKEAEERRLKEPVRSKLLRLVGLLRSGATGSARKEALDELEATAQGLKTEELVGDSDVEKRAKAEREKAEKEREKAEREAKKEV